jgi:hypothetical protein
MRGSFHVIKKIKVPLEIIVNSEAGHLNAIAIVLITLKFYAHPYDHFHLEWLAVAQSWNSNEYWRWSKQNSQNPQAFNQDVLTLMLFGATRKLVPGKMT